MGRLLRVRTPNSQSETASNLRHRQGNVNQNRNELLFPTHQTDKNSAAAPSIHTEVRRMERSHPHPVEEAFNVAPTIFGKQFDLPTWTELKLLIPTSFPPRLKNKNKAWEMVW